MYGSATSALVNSIQESSSGREHGRCVQLRCHVIWHATKAHIAAMIVQARQLLRSRIRECWPPVLMPGALRPFSRYAAQALQLSPAKNCTYAQRS